MLSINRFWKIKSYWQRTDAKLEPWLYLIVTVTLVLCEVYAVAMFIYLEPSESASGKAGVLY
eukprot:3938814-Rhodomonas_salina.1